MKDTIFTKFSRIIKSHQNDCWLTAIIILMLLWKAILISKNVFPFNSDEAIVALMAKHILSGERPIFFYGQAYMGSLDAYLVAFGFAIVGQKVVVIRIVQSLLYAFTIVITYFIGKMAFQSARSALITALILAFPTINGMIYTTISLGGYGEALLLGVLQILITLKIKKTLDESSFSFHLYLFMGFLTGLGFWVHGMTLVFSIPCWLYLLYKFMSKKIPRKSVLYTLLFIIIGFALGILPMIIFVFQQGSQSVWMELFGSAVSVETGGWFSRVLNHLLYLLIFGIPVMFGLRPPWTTILQIPWLIPFVVLAVLLIGYVLYQEIRKRILPEAAYLFLGIILILFAAFVGTSFGVDPSGRYFLPLIIPGSLLAGYAVGKLIGVNKAFSFIVIVFCLYQIMVTWHLANKPPYLTTQFYTPAMLNHDYDEELIAFLKENDLETGYSNYWVAYPLAFLSDEALIYIPALPYHPDFRFTERDNRYTPYTEIVEYSDNVSYIVTNNPDLEDVLTSEFSWRNISFSYQEIGDFHIYYDLSELIRPDQLRPKFYVK
ncbi:MAG: glycosyltransferase family 39 protein [Anaerolineaceae bacterium]|nr:glycosyltransferase family 39 protein [Anaerolineaceae bacterium]